MADKKQTPIQDQLEKFVLKRGDLVSSQPTGIDTAIKDSIASVKTGQEASTKRIESSFGRELAFQAKEAGLARKTQLEGRRGGATQTVALNALDTRTEKSLRDLEQRKQELILQGEGQAAGQIANLQIQSLQFKMKAEQQVFQNLISVSTLDMQQKAQDTAVSQFTAQMAFKQKEFDLTQRTKIADIATKFGVSIDPGESIASIVNKVKPFAEQQRNAEIKKTLKDIESEATKLNLDSILTDKIVTGGMSPVDAAVQSIADLEAIGLKPTKEELNNALKRAQEISDTFKVESDRAKAEVDSGGIIGSVIDFFKNRESKQSTGFSGVENDRLNRLKNAQSLQGTNLSGGQKAADIYGAFFEQLFSQ